MNKARFAADDAEWQQCHFRVVTVLLAITYSAWHQLSTPMVYVALTAVIGAGCWYLTVAYGLGSSRTRIVSAMIYDCLIVSWAMLILDSSGMGLYCIFLWISVGYPIRYKRPRYAFIGIVLTLGCFSVVAAMTGLARAHPDLFLGVVASLVFAPLRIAQLLKKLIVSEKVKDEFIANVSHDLLTPINSIMGFSERIRKGYAEDHQDYAEHIYASAHLLASLLRSVIDTVSLGDPEENSDFSVQEIVRMVTFSNSNLAREKGIAITANVDIGFPVCGPQYVVISCLLNLVNNAVKYSDGGTICITANYDEKKEQLCLSVADEGKGIEEELHTRIFERFYRAPSAAGIAGLGIGLTGIKKSLESVGGNIVVSSSTKGTVFSFCLPAEMSGKKQVEKNYAIRRSDFRLMLVDDDPLSCKAWSSNLVHAGYMVTTAGSSSEALKILDRRPDLQIDLFVLDYRMPGMDGVDLAKEIKSIRSAPIMLISADPPGLFNHLVASGSVDAVLQKPFSANRLITHIERYLAAAAISKRALPESVKMELRQLYLNDLFSYIETLRGEIAQKEVNLISHKLKSGAAIIGDRIVLEGLNRLRGTNVSKQILLRILLRSECLHIETKVKQEN